MPKSPVILVIGTGDTKTPELMCIRDTIIAKGGKALMMDVGVVGEPEFEPDIRKEDVAGASGKTIPELIAMEDENISMAAMAAGAARLAEELHSNGQIDGMIALGGTMGTDLAFDVALALPIGVPKMVISSVAYSHLIPPERIAADLMMILWAGGLWGVNSISRAVLEQAAGAVVGACRPAGAASFDKPAIAISALGQAGLKYMKRLEPELSRRGYDVIVFHAVGIGGRAMESLISQDAFVAVLDLALIEVSDDALGSCITGGESRLRTAGEKGLPQIVAPGAIDGLDFATWAGIPAGSEGQDTHAHNRLISVAKMTVDQRRKSAQEIVNRLKPAKGPLRFILPLKGFDEWDREGGPLHDAEGHAAQVEVLRAGIEPQNLVEIEAHINDDLFTETVLREFDAMVRDGLIPSGQME